MGKKKNIKKYFSKEWLKHPKRLKWFIGLTLGMLAIFLVTYFIDYQLSYSFTNWKALFYVNLFPAIIYVWMMIGVWICDYNEAAKESHFNMYETDKLLRDIERENRQNLYGSSYRDSYEKSGSFFDDDAMTKDYYGKHGEFDNNDRIRANSEDMQQFRSTDKDFDPSDHGYDWDEVADAESDGYLDD